MLKITFFVPLLAGALFASTAQAQDTGAQSIKIGETDLTPLVRIDFVSDSNAFLTPDDEVSTTGVIVSPSATFRAERRLLTLDFGYEGDYGSFDDDALNYDDHTLFANVNAELSSRRRVAGSFSVTDRHEELGANLTRSIADADTELVESVDTDLDANFTFGAQAARGNIIGGLSFRNRSFISQDELTDGLDFFTITPYAQFSYRLSSDTRALIELRFSQFDFDDDLRDRSDTQVLTGLTFRGTGRTGGSARIGITAANFSEDEVEDTSFFSANINVFYLPTSFSRISLAYTRELDNTGNVVLSGDDNDQDVRDVFRAVWEHRWSAFVNTRVVASLDNRDRVCPADATTTGSGNFEIGLKPRRWVEFGAGLQISERTTDTCPGVAAENQDLGFDRQTFNVFARVSL